MIYRCILFVNDFIFIYNGIIHFLTINKLRVMKKRWRSSRLRQTTPGLPPWEGFRGMLLTFFMLVFAGTGFLQAQEGRARLSGTVRDDGNKPLPGVTVVVRGTTSGTVTDASGNFLIADAPAAGTLMVSFVGMTTREIPYRGSQVLNNIVLAETAIGVDEVVVIGYGSVRKRDLTGTVASVGSEDIKAIGTSSPMAALQSQVAGVNITPRTGLVGSDYIVEIRGVNSLTGGAPLFVVDGVMTDNINFLNANDIERIDILKDASSTAIYGSRGSNGVVLVTTKTGKESKGRAVFSYSGSAGVRTIANMPDFLNYDEGVIYTMNRDIAKKLYTGSALVAPDNLFGFPGTGDAHAYWVKALAEKRSYDWMGETLKPSLEMNHFISGSGGNDRVTFLVGAGYQGDDGNIKGQYFRKYNFKANVDAALSDMWSVGTNINIAYTDRELLSRDAYKSLIRMAPWTPAFNEAGELLQAPMVGISGNVSPLADMKNNQFNTETYYVISNFYLALKPVKWMELRSTFSPNVRLSRRGLYRDPLSTKSIAVGDMTFTRNLSWIWDNQLSARRDYGSHAVGLDLIYSMQSDEMESLYGYGRTLPFNSGYWNLGSGATMSTSSSYLKSTLMSYTGRVNYSLLDKYLFTASARWDGSSKLAEGQKWAFFPSAAIAWRASEEEFIQALNLFSNLKMRLSYGYTGNNNINPYVTQFAANRQTYYDWNGTSAFGFKPSAIANKALTWERTREWNLGIDYGFLNNRISGEINLYDRLSLNLLMPRKLAIPTGWASMMDNIGSVSNKGVEFQIRTINVQTKDFYWETNLTFSTNKNAIVELYGKKEDDVANRWFIGEPVDVIYSMVFDGVWQKEELVNKTPAEQRTLEGTAKVKDLNDDKIIDIDHDMTILGSPLPEWIGSLSTRFRYKAWDLMASLYTKQGVFIYSPFHREFLDFNSKQIIDVPYYMRENPFTEARYSNEYPQPSYMGQYWGEDAEDYGYPGFNKDASFVRLQNISLGYTLPESLISKIGMSSARIYVNVLNPYVWTKYDGFDPEWAGASIDGDNANSTSFRIFQFGTNISF